MLAAFIIAIFVALIVILFLAAEVRKQDQVINDLMNVIDATNKDLDRRKDNA